MKLSGIRWLDANTLLIRVAALVALLGIPFKRLPRRAQEFQGGVENILPFHLARTSHLVSFILGIGLLYIASQVSLRKRNSLYLAVAALVILIVAELSHYRNPVQLTLYVATLATLLWNRRQFVVMSDSTSLRRGLLTAAGIVVVMLLFVLVVFEVIDQRAFGKDYTTGQTISITYNQLTNGPQQALPSDVRFRRYDRMLLDLLRVSGVAITLIVVASLFQPLKLRRRAPHGHALYARTLLERYSTSPEDYFKLWPADKHYFFFREGFVAYTVANGVALVLDGASGWQDDLSGVRSHFLDYARLNGWQVAVIHADTHEAQAWQTDGMDEMKQVFIGSEAFVETDEFMVHTMRGKHFRYVRNRAGKDGLGFVAWQPPLNDTQLSQLQTVSDAWLQEGGKREYTYMMGYFDREYLRNCHVTVLTRTEEDGTSQTVAYANIIPVFAKAVASVDHIRSIPGVSGVAMHYLLMETIGYAAGQGAKTFNLGLAPLSKLDEKAEKNLNERMLAIVKQLGGRYYSFAGLEQFKGKFIPSWDPRYIVYQRGTRLLNVAVALNSVVAYGSNVRGTKRTDLWRPWLIGLAVVAGLSYASFPLGLMLNPSHAFKGLVSFLGQSDQPYNWVFDELDVVSAVVSMFVLLLIARRYRIRGKFYLWALGLAIANSLGTLVAAVIPLPDDYEDLSIRAVLQAGDIQVIFHGIASFVNSAAFVVAAALWAWAWRHKPGGVWRMWLAIVMVVLSTVGFAVGEWYPASSPAIQRLFIFSYATWLVAFVYDMTGHMRRTRQKKK
jgi:phosphatidylglycerol lysyltransferase